MGDDLIPPAIPEGGSGKTPPENQSSNKSPQTKQENIETPHMDKGHNAKAAIFSVIAFASLECLGIYFWQIADGLSGGLVVIFHWFSLCCIVAGPFAATHQIIDDKKTQNLIWAIFIIIPCSINVPVAYVVWHPVSQKMILSTPQAQQKPFKFSVVLDESNSPNPWLWLTNDFLQFAKIPPFDKTVRGDLIVPIKSIDSPPILNFVIFNDSDMPSDPVHISFVLGNEANFDAPQWERFERATDAITKSRSVIVKVDSVVPQIGAGLPDIILKNCLAISNLIPAQCLIQIMSDNGRDSYLAFWLVVPITTNLTKPCVVLSTNGIVDIPLSDPK